MVKILLVDSLANHFKPDRIDGFLVLLIMPEDLVGLFFLFDCVGVILFLEFCAGKGGLWDGALS